MLRELVTTLMDCRRTGGNYLFGKGRFVLRGFTADPAFELSKCAIIKDSNTTTTGTARAVHQTVQLPGALAHAQTHIAASTFLRVSRGGNPSAKSGNRNAGCLSRLTVLSDHRSPPGRRRVSGQRTGADFRRGFRSGKNARRGNLSRRRQSPQYLFSEWAIRIHRSGFRKDFPERDLQKPAEAGACASDFVLCQRVQQPSGAAFRIHTG